MRGQFECSAEGRVPNRSPCDCPSLGRQPFDGPHLHSHIPAMAILKIARMGHPVLARRAEPVPDPTTPEVRRLVADMIDTMADADGAGLAAPQVHVPLRIVVFQAPGERSEAGVAGSESFDHTAPPTVPIHPLLGRT